MPRLFVGIPGEANELELEVADARGVLLGRSPEPQSLEPATLAERAPLHGVSVNAASVSANHLAVWSDGNEITVWDVGSRHGTWLKLPSSQPVRVTAAEPLHLRLSDAHPPAARLTQPRETDCEATEFADAVTRSIEAWLLEHAVAVRIKYSERRRREHGADHPGRVPLASGGELSIVPQQTMDARWEGMLREIWRYVERENTRFESEEASRAEGLILASSAIRKVHRQVLEAAQRGVRLMLVGPSGVGKEGLARVFHRHSGRAGAFVPRNCAMFTKELVRAELFGAEPGAYTGATRRIVGAVERANGGTLFLDELGEMPLDVQPTLLRFLDRGEFERMGDYGIVRVSDVRLVAATNRDLREALERNEFRTDLWYRLSNDVIELPPLRERFDDVRAYLKTQRFGAAGESAFDLLSSDAQALLHEHRWDGNFRELHSFSARLLASASGTIDADRCRELLARGTLSRVPSTKPSSPPPAPVTSNEHELWTTLAQRAAAAFADDVGHEMPANWDEVKEFVEKYFKPLLFVHLGHGKSASSKDDIDVTALARRLGADRGTAARQIERYLELLGR